MFDDDAERLVLADQMIARGDLRGELIVAQCELARGGHTRARGIALRKREHELLTAHGDAWSNVAGLASVPVWRRGFVEEIRIPLEVLAARESEVWARLPYLRHLHVWGLDYNSANYGSELDRADIPPVLAKVERVLSSGRVTSFEACDAYVSWARMGQWDYMMTQDPLDDEIVTWLVESERLATLRGLELRALSLSAFSLLAASPLASEIEDLRINVELLHEPTGIHVANLHPQRLELVDRGTFGQVAIVRRLLHSPLAKNVTDLTLHWAVARGELAFAQLPFTRGLRRLATRMWEFEKDARVLADCPELSALEELVLIDGALHPSVRDLAALHKPQHLESLRVLRLGCLVDPQVALDFLGSPLARRLEAIDFRPAAPELAKALGSCGWDGCLYV